MLRVLAVLALLLPIHAYAQTYHHHPMGGGDPRAMQKDRSTPSRPTQPGQGAFAAIQEIVELLEADPKTDWSKVNIDALRQHLIDMSNVTLAADVTGDPIEGGIRYTVSSGDDRIRDSIRRMVLAHAATMNGVGGWTFTAAETERGAVLTVLVPASDAIKLRGLGFMGVMARGMHHQEHHLMIARGENPHH